MKKLIFLILPFLFSACEKCVECSLNNGYHQFEETYCSDEMPKGTTLNEAVSILEDDGYQCVTTND